MWLNFWALPHVHREENFCLDIDLLGKLRVDHGLFGKGLKQEGWDMCDAFEHAKLSREVKDPLPC